MIVTYCSTHTCPFVHQGKTVQVAAYLGAAASSRKLDSVLIVAPATILQHWLTELSIWAPGLRRVLVHSSGGSDTAEKTSSSRAISLLLLQKLARWLYKARADRVNEAIDEEDWNTMEPHMFCGTGYAIVTTYENVRRHIDVYAAHQWSYMVLDEAQKIRNPDADVTLACKRIRTFHRLAMSGTPIQNDLRELWSLLDFVFPGRLGTLPTFEEEFAVPIKRGGYSNASPMHVQLAYRCAITLRDLILPFLLRRLKKDIKEVSRMPGKTEHVLFCRLSQRQRAMYEAYLLSDDVKSVIRRSSGNGGGTQLLAAVTMLRKIANHPDLILDPTESSLDQFVRSHGSTRARPTNGDSSDDDSGAEITLEDTLLERSGKLEVLAKILPLWKQQGHRVLIFCQWRKMLDIIERFTQISGWKFGRLDGNTNIASRQRLVDTFNTDESYFGMLCTTRTGGVGLNLIGGE
jgi:DNA excision repair protein ERCC-6